MKKGKSRDLCKTEFENLNDRPREQRWLLMAMGFPQFQLDLTLVEQAKELKTAYGLKRDVLAREVARRWKLKHNTEKRSNNYSVSKLSRFLLSCPKLSKVASVVERRPPNESKTKKGHYVCS